MGEEFKTKNSRTTSTRYLDRFFSLKSAEELVKLKLFPNAKEITESFAMLNAVETTIHNSDPTITKDNEDVVLIVVGDGQKPRTAGLCAFMTRWRCYSVDPDLRWLDPTNEISRLICMPKRAEDIKITLTKPGPVIIMMPHSHAPLHAAWTIAESAKKWLINMRCCTKDVLDVPSVSYTDPFVASPKNRMDIHCNYMFPEFISGK